MDQKTKNRLFDILFEADTRPGKIFNISILIIICLSILVVLLESVPGYGVRFKTLFIVLEWTFTFIFLVEYILRIYTTRNKWRYIFSFFGLIDLLAILPAFLAFFLTGAHSLIVIRAFRLLRVFRILKVSRYTRAGRTLSRAIQSSMAKIGVFLFTVTTIVVLVGTIMYLIEGEENGFTNIPKSIYWAIVTLTTVGYGDITPQTAFGQFVSSLVMILGYAIIAVPTGIISVEIARSSNEEENTQVCPHCLESGHENDAIYCKHCGGKINE